VPDRVDRFIMTHSRAGRERVRIMTGKGTGKVRATVINYLRLGGYPWEYERLEGGKRNEGVLIVFLS
jgi:hypothetical protein